MIKVVYLPLNSPEIIQTGMYDAWAAAGVELHVFDFYQKAIDKVPTVQIRKQFVEMVAAVKPALVHMQLQFTNVIDAATVIEAKKTSQKTIFTNWTGDIRTNVPGDFVSISNVVDVSLISSVGQIELYQKAGCQNVKYWQIGYNPKLYFPLHKTKFKYDVSFAGAYYGDIFPGSPIRLETITKLQNRYGSRFGLFGSNFPKNIKTLGSVSQKSLNEIYADSLCVLSINNFNDVSYYFSDRLLMCMASGRPTISFRFPGTESYFTNNSDLVTCYSADEIVNAIDSLKENPVEAERIGDNGYLRVSSEHTYTSRVLELLHLVGVKQ